MDAVSQRAKKQRVSLDLGVLKIHGLNHGSVRAGKEVLQASARAKVRVCSEINPDPPRKVVSGSVLSGTSNVEFLGIVDTHFVKKARAMAHRKVVAETCLFVPARALERPKNVGQVTRAAHKANRHQRHQLLVEGR
jgi:hypothetical protein